MECELVIHHRDECGWVMCAGLGCGSRMVPGCLVRVVQRWHWTGYPHASQPMGICNEIT